MTVSLPELLLAVGGSLQRLDVAGVPVDLLELVELDDAAEQAAVAALRCLELRHLSRHRLALPAPLGVERTADVVAAMSELIGFDPEPGVLCLVPGPGDGSLTELQAVDAAAALIGEAYRIRMMCFSLQPDARGARVELDLNEWRRKRDSLAAFAVEPGGGRREYFTG